MSSFGASAHQVKFVSEVLSAAGKHNNRITINNERVHFTTSGVVLETAAIWAMAAAAAAAAVVTVDLLVDISRCREMVGNPVVLLGKDGVVVGNAETYDWRGRLAVGQKRIAPTQDRAWVKDGMVFVRCSGFVAGLLAERLKAIKAEKAPPKAEPPAPSEDPPADPPKAEDPPAPEPKAENPWAALKAELEAIKAEVDEARARLAKKPAPAPKAEEPEPEPKSAKTTHAPSPAVAARHAAEERFIAAVTAAMALGSEVPQAFQELMGSLMLLSIARDEEAPAEAFAALNHTRGLALSAVRGHGPSGIPEIDDAFRALEAAAKAAKAARAA